MHQSSRLLPKFGRPPLFERIQEMPQNLCAIFKMAPKNPKIYQRVPKAPEIAHIPFFSFLQKHLETPQKAQKFPIYFTNFTVLK